MLAEMLADVAVTAATPWYWHAVGYGGQIVFGSRFYVQWLHSERHRRSVVPVVFWWLSLLGGLMTLAYAIYKLEGPFIMANIGGPPIYARNLWLIHKARQLPPSAIATPPAVPLPPAPAPAPMPPSAPPSPPSSPPSP